MEPIRKVRTSINRKISKRWLERFKKIPGFYRIRKDFSGKTGLEIGGPSDVFSADGCIPLYPIATVVDGCNFSTKTVWENTIIEGDNYKYGDIVLGYQYIKDATDLSGIESEQYDFLLSSHSLEHIANPLKAISEWLRVLKKGGVLLLLLPDKNHTFDHKRPYTSFAHLLEDYKQDTTERDMTHLEEILSLHDLSMDLPAGDIDQFKKRSQDNYTNRCLHQHVFDLQLLEDIFSYFKLKIVLNKAVWPVHLVIMGRKK